MANEYIKNGTGGPLKKAGSFTPEQIERIQNRDLEQMTAAIEAVDGWATMPATELASRLLKMGTNPPFQTEEVRVIWA